MGISGLLQALKPIQVTKHLEDYSGHTFAVDAYVWLHKGLYSCATELATGKKTHKYVDYAMHRVRLLKHYRIQPYIVFDGGPLPAKRGTEQERKQKREENLARGNALAAQGKHSQARECYVKCVDVTPQMAFQFIKALRTENVPYVVAPYEADVQLAYLEKLGLVDAILTEDSDLLVFGCKHVLYKLDVVSNTVVSISRDQFGSVTASASDPNSISLYGWSDTQFRAMAILSGCDYLVSIPGVGLKTANSLLRKWKSAEQVVRAIALEGKKTVPVGYWKNFRLAEMCFLHQRAYCPLTEKLVHLTEVGTDWNEELDAYVGSDIDPPLAKSIAMGDTCPITRLPMIDINTEFNPRACKKPLPQVSVSPSKSRKTKGKMRGQSPTGGILSFFGPKPVIPPRTKIPTVVSTPKLNCTGKGSGKRTLAEVVDNELQQKKKLRRSPSPGQHEQKQSKFFSSRSVSKLSSVKRRHSEGELGFDHTFSRPASVWSEENKENECVLAPQNSDGEDVNEPDLDGSEVSLRAEIDVLDVVVGAELNVAGFPDAVEQEEGYISPTPSYSRDVQDLSSPVRPSERKEGKRSLQSKRDRSEEFVGTYLSDVEEQDLCSAVLSSPISGRKLRGPRETSCITPTKSIRQDHCETILVDPTPTPTKQQYQDVDEVPSPTVYHGPDLRNILGSVTELGVSPEAELVLDSGSTLTPSPSPNTPIGRDYMLSILNTTTDRGIEAIDVDAFTSDLEQEQTLSHQAASRTKAVMDGWRQRWALPPKTMAKTLLQSKKMVESPKKLVSLSRSKRPRSIRASPLKRPLIPGSGALRAANLRRTETTVSSAGRHSLCNAIYKTPKSAPPKMSAASKIGSTSSAMDRREKSLKHPPPALFSRKDELEILSRTHAKLSQYRCS